MEDNDIDETTEVVEIPATPWHNSDTVAATFTFAANMAAAASQHFAHLAYLAMGQSAQEWVEADKAEFIDDMSQFLGQLPEEDVDD